MSIHRQIEKREIKSLFSFGQSDWTPGENRREQDSCSALHLQQWPVPALSPKVEIWRQSQAVLSLTHLSKSCWLHFLVLSPIYPLVPTGHHLSHYSPLSAPSIISQMMEQPLPLLFLPWQFSLYTSARLILQHKLNYVMFLHKIL